MTDPWTDRLSDYLDGELAPGEARRAEEHLAECRECATTLEELRAVVSRARNLEAQPPAEDLWPAIDARIRTGAGASPLRRGRPEPAGRRFSFSVPQLAAAAVALMLLSGGAAWILRGGVPSSRGPGLAGGDVPGGAAAASAPGVTRPGGPALARYEAAVAELERAVFLGEGTLDTATVRKLRESLATIDRAIAEAREALREDPADTYLNQHLAETMRRKVRVLQQTATLVAAQG